MLRYRPIFPGEKQVVFGMFPLFPDLKTTALLFAIAMEGSGFYAIKTTDIADRIYPCVYLLLLKNPQALWLVLNPGNKGVTITDYLCWVVLVSPAPPPDHLTNSFPTDRAVLHCHLGI